MAWARTLNLKHVALVAWILDVLSCLYMMRWWEVKNMNGRMLNMSLQMARIRGQHIPDGMEAEFGHMAQLLLSGMLLALVITNTIFYTGYAYQKRWAIPYVTAYLISAGVVGLTFLLEGFPVGGAWELVNIIGIPTYFVLGFVAWTLKRDAKLNPGGGSPAR